MANIWVDAVNGNDTNDGSSSEQSVLHIYKGIDIASSNDVIICKSGTYNSELYRTIDFNLTIESETGDFQDVIIEDYTTNSPHITYSYGWLTNNANNVNLTLKNLTIRMVETYTGASGYINCIINAGNYTGQSVDVISCFLDGQELNRPCGLTNASSNSIALNVYKCTFRNFRSTDGNTNVFQGGNGIFANNAGISYTVKDNIFENCFIGIYANGGSTVDDEYNCFYNNTNDIYNHVIDGTDITSDPLFDSYTVAKISPISNCVDAGIVISGIVTEFTGSAPNMGAYEIPEIEVTTELETNRTHNSARLNGDIISLGEASELEAYFEYWKDESGASVNTTSKQLKSIIGTYYIDISGLENNTTYIFKAIVDDTSSASGAGFSEGVELSFTTKSLESQTIVDTANISDSIETTFTKIKEINETINVSDSLSQKFNQELVETINVTDTTYTYIPILRTGTANYARKIIHTNPLIVVCNTNPVEIAKIDITTWDEPGWTVYTLNDTGEDYANALDVCVNDTFDKVYIACNNGKIAQLDLSDFEVRTEIDVTETEQLNHIACVDDLKVTFTSTNASTKELIRIDDATTVKVNTDFRFLQRIITKIKTMFHYISAKIINTDFRYLSEILTKLSTDFRYTLEDYDAVTPISRTDFTVKVDGTPLGIGDIVLDSINVRWISESPSEATFKLARYHDKVNYTLDNDYVQITNNNAVIVELNSREIFTGKIETVDASGNNESVNIVCKGTIRHPFYNTTNLPLCGVEERRHLYHIIDNNVSILKEVEDYRPVDTEPTIYKGITVDLGLAEHRAVIYNAPITLNKEKFDSFIPDQNVTYFWFVNSNNFMTSSTVEDVYVGTSLTGLSDGFWDINSVKYRRQTKASFKWNMGTYEVGEAPFKEISVNNGYLWIDSYYEDREDGLYKVNPSGSYVRNPYVKKVADVEYEKLKDVNGVIGGAVTNASIDITMDALLYYNLGLLTKINISNTTEANIYLDNNGFPVTIKGVSISASSMKTTLTLDNRMTEAQLLAIEHDQYPKDPGVWTTVPAFWRRNRKYDLNQGRYL